MKRLRNHFVGIDQGEHVLFSDFADDGPMWTGTGPRVHTTPISFSESYRSAPAVHVSMSMWDVGSGRNSRVDLSAEAITDVGFSVVFRTWDDTRIARVRVGWLAIGELRHADEWDLY